MATVRKRGTRFQVQIRLAGCLPISRTFSKRSTALEWARGMESEADRRGLPANVKELRKVTVDQILARYLKLIVPRKRGADVEEYVIEALRRQPLATMSLAELTPQVIADYRDERLLVVQPATVVRQLTILQHAFDVARKEWGIPIERNPVKDVTRPRVVNRRVQRLKPSELQSLLDGCSLCRKPWLKPIIEIAVETGLRRGEILALRWQEVDWVGHTVYIPETKTGEPRCVPLSPRALAILQPLQNASTDERVFPTSADAVKKAWQRLISRTDIVDRHFHDLRHEAISRFFELGLTLPEVALISGHKDPRMLFRYTHMSASRIADKLRLKAPEH